MIEPPPHLSVPFDLSEVDEAQEAAQAYAAQLGYKCYSLADDVAAVFDQPHEYWKPEHVPGLEKVYTNLEVIINQLKNEGHECIKHNKTGFSS